MKRKKRTVEEWAERIQWGKRVKAICKPCWEIKYCPYGPLVEEFPLRKERDKRSCIVFGHDCPVFHVAEPLTETKELRNISRDIPRVTQFRVLKRENQICLDCGKSVKDEDIEFDHIIPWSKGGSSDEHNVRLLCKDCNKKKGVKFEEKYLIKSLGELILEPVSIEVACVLLEDAEIGHEVFNKYSRDPVPLDYCRSYGRRKVRDYDEFAAQTFKTISEFFTSQKPKELKQRIFNALRYRWGFKDRQVHTLEETSKTFGIETSELLTAEVSLIERLGWNVKLTESTKNKWLRL